MPKRQKQSSLPMPGLPVQLTLPGPTSPVDVKSLKEAWSDYQLDDGSVLSVKPLIADVRRVKGKYNEHGDPLYLVTAAMVIRTKSPRRLRKKGR